jgi:hypothetical protein
MSSETKQKATSGAFSVGSSALLDCPFCGEQPKLHKSYSGWTVVHICPNNAIHSNMGYMPKKEAIKIWNSRPISNREFEFIEALKMYAPNHELLND